MYYKKIGVLPAFKEHKTEYIAGIAASLVAIIALSRFAARKITPRSVVEIADRSLGLNKKGINKEFAEDVKDKILHPLMTVKSGQWKRLFEGEFANGMIIAGEEAEAHSKAFVEHAEKLGIQCFKIDSCIEGKQNILTNIYRAISEAEEVTRFNRKNCVIIDIGNLDKALTMSNSKSIKKDLSKVEAKLTSLPRGIVWSGWTNNTEKIPYYYNNTPTEIFLLQ